MIISLLTNIVVLTNTIKPLKHKMNNTNFETYFETKWKAVLVETYSQEEAKRIYDYSMYRIGRVQLKAKPF